MATTYQNPSRPMGRTTAQKPRATKATSQQSPSTIANNSKGIKLRLGNNSSKNSMYKPSSILKKKPFERPYIDDQFNQNIVDWHQPSDLETIKSRPFYSPIRTPPRLRTLITPPGLEPYRNHRNLRRLTSPLPGLGDWYSAPVRLDTWGLDPIDNRLNSNLNLIRRHPSPLSDYGLGSALLRQRKPYIVVPRLNNFVSPPVSSRGGANYFTLPSRRLAPIYVPDSQYTYLDRIHSFALPRLHREPSDYVYIRQNDAFANRYIEDFIGKCIEDQFIPDILLEIIGELDQENKNRGGKSHTTEVDRYYAELNKRISQDKTKNTHLFSDDWIRELDHQRSPVQTTNRLRYHDLPSDVQGRLLADINQELIDYEVQNMMRELSNQTLTNTIPNVPMRDQLLSRQKDQVQYNEIEKYAENKLLDTICLDELILKYIKQHGSVVDIDDLSRLLDGNILQNLIYQYEDIDQNRSRTLDNYASRNFHLNSFMNITMDLLLTELSASLIEDMKDLDEQERKTF